MNDLARQQRQAGRSGMVSLLFMDIIEYRLEVAEVALKICKEGVRKVSRHGQMTFRA